MGREVKKAGVRRVLVVEDNPDVAEMLGELLTTLGQEVRVAPDARQAISLAADFQPHLAILDIGLPDADGFTLAQALLSLPSHERLAIVALSALGDPETKRRASAAGMRRHFTKPASLDDIAQMIDECEPVES